MLHPGAKAAIDTAMRDRVTLGDPGSAPHKPVLAEVRAALNRALEASSQQAVISTLLTPPGSPVTGAVYRVAGGSPTGAWVGKANQIAEWDGAAWLFGVPLPGDRVFDIAAGVSSEFNGTGWVAPGPVGDGRYILASQFLPTDGTTYTAGAWSTLVDYAIAQKKPIWIDDGVVFNLGADGKAVTLSAGQNLTIESRTGVLRRTADSTARMISITGGSPQIRGVTFEYTAGTTSVAGENGPVLFKQCAAATAERNRVIGPWYVGIESRSGRYDRILANDIRGVVNRGIYISAFDNTDSIGPLVADNDIDGRAVSGGARLTAYAINFNCFGEAGTEIYQPRVINNTLRGFAAHGLGIGDEVYQPQVRGNAFSDADASAPNILLQHASAREANRTIISGNTTLDGLFGLQANLANDMLVEGNSFVNPGYSAIINYGSIGMQVIGNNAVMLAGTRFYVGASSAPADAAHVDVQNNQVVFAASTGSTGVQTDNTATNHRASGNRWRNCQFPNLLGTGAAMIYAGDNLNV
jgi:hypothetical protein